MRVAHTGAKRDARAGKGRYDLLPPRGIHAVAHRFESGAAAYGDRNWEKGQPLSWFLDSGLRHGFNVLAGLEDEDHAAAAAWNFLCYLETRERIRLGLLPASLNDLPSAGPAISSNSAGRRPGTAPAGTTKVTDGKTTRRARRSRRPQS